MEDRIIVDDEDDFVAEKIVERKKEKNGISITERIRKQSMDTSKLFGYVGLGASLLIIIVMLFVYPSSFAFYLNYGYSFLVMLPYLMIASAGLVCSCLCNKRKENFLFKLGFILSIFAVSLCLFIPIWCLII